VTTFDLSPEGVTAALRTLDAESWEIAEKLRAAGVKGTPMDECKCVLAVYIASLMPEGTEVHVEAEHIWMEGWTRTVDGFDERASFSRRLPDGAQDLVQEFDKGEYPDLIEGES
jgi:hypothetical protein